MKSKIAVALALSLSLLAIGCATKGFVRKEVSTSVEQLNKQLSQRIEASEQSINDLDSQVDEVREVTSQNRQRVEQLSGEVTEARRVGTEAKEAAEKTGQRVDTLGRAFVERNNYQVLQTEEVFFKFNRWNLMPDEQAKLDEVAALLADNPDAVVELEGYTDTIGPRDYNLVLGEKRVDSVARYLAIKHNVPLRRIYKFSFGEEKAGNESRAARKQNRKVTVRVLAPPEVGGIADSGATRGGRTGLEQEKR